MSDTTRLAFIAGFWQGAYEFGAGGDEITDEEVDEFYDRWAQYVSAVSAAISDEGGATDA